MACKIKIDVERCKGCALCVQVCPKGCIAISTKSNKNGYFPAEVQNGQCSGCSACAVICPETIITVYRDIKIAESRQATRVKPDLVREKS